MPSELEALATLVKEMEAEFKKEKVLMDKLKKALKGNQMPKKWFLRDVKPILDQVKTTEGTRQEVKSVEQSINRLERQIELLQQELAALKRDALTEVDIRPFKKLL